MTAPLDYNPGLDRLIAVGVPGTARQVFPTSEAGDWRPEEHAEGLAQAGFVQAGSRTVGTAELAP